MDISVINYVMSDSGWYAPSYNPIITVEYTVRGRVYSGTIKEYHLGMKAGDMIPIHYHWLYPSEILAEEDEIATDAEASGMQRIWFGVKRILIGDGVFLCLFLILGLYGFMKKHYWSSQAKSDMYDDQRKPESGYILNGKSESGYVLNGKPAGGERKTGFPKSYGMQALLILALFYVGFKTGFASLGDLLKYYGVITGSILVNNMV